MQLGSNIKRLRKEKGLSQAGLASKVGCHLSNINRVETGKYIPSLETVAAIANVLEMPIDYLVNGTEEITEEVRIEDKTLAERMKLLNTLDEEERMVVTKVIDAMLTKRKMLNLLTERQIR